MIAATLGLFLRAIQTGLIIAHFKNFMHTHSHIALLGWLYNASFIIVQYVIYKKKKGAFNSVFWLSQLTFLGMMFSFPFQGYAFASITFSTLYLFCTYFLVYVMFKESTQIENPYVIKFMRWGGMYLVLSSLGPYSLAYIMVNGLVETFWYKLSVYWFLHFLYNGFFAFIVFGYFLSKIDSNKNEKLIFWLMNASVIPLYALSVLWIKPDVPIYFLALIGSVLQLVSFIIVLKVKSITAIFNTNWIWKVIVISAIAYSLKMVFQVISVLPVVQSFLLETVAYSVIGFIHLVMLGFFTLFFIGIFIKEELMKLTNSMKIGLIALIIGIILSELLLFGQSVAVTSGYFMIPNYQVAVFVVSSLMPIGIGFIIWSYFKN